MNKLYNCAVIGLGNIGYKFNLDPKRKETWTHVEAYSKCSVTKLIATVEVDLQAAQVFKDGNPDIPVYSTIRDLFSNHKVDIVSICVPTKYHFPVFSEVIKHDIKAIFCEKPLSYCVQESEKMVELAKEKGIYLAVNYTRQWQNTYYLARQIIEKNNIGQVKVVNSFYPGQIYNIGSHLFNAVMLVSGIRPFAVSAVKVNEEQDPSLSGWLKCRENIFFTFSSTGKREDLIFEIDVIGQQGRIRIADNGSNVERFMFKESKRYSGYRELVAEEFDLLPENDRFLEAVLDIVDVIEGKRKSVRCSGEDALFVDRIIEKAVISAEKGGSVENI